MKNNEPDFDVWKRCFHEILLEDRHARRSWKHLAESQLNMDLVCFWLWLACDFEGSPGYHITSYLGESLATRRKEASRLEKRLRADKIAIEAFGRSQAQQEASASLETLASELATASKEIRRMASKRNLNPIIFRLWMMEEVRNTAKRPCFRELSFLLDAAYEAHGQEPPTIDADTLRKSYQRYVQDRQEDGKLTPLGLAIVIIADLLVRKFLSLPRTNESVSLAKSGPETT